MIDEADLAGHDADRGHPGARREAEPLGLGPGVADHERGTHGRRGDQDRHVVPDVRRAPARRCRGRRGPRRQRSKIESMNAPNWLTLPVARASVPSNMSKTPPTKTTMPPTSHSLRADEDRAPTMVIPKPMSVSPFGRQAEPAHRRARSARRSA